MNYKKGIYNLKRKLYKKIKQTIVIIIICMIILANTGVQSFAFTTKDLGGVKLAPGRMPVWWVEEVKKSAREAVKYSQARRTAENTYDCSSFVSRMVQKLLKKPELDNMMSTGTIKYDKRFKKIPVSDIQPWDIVVKHKAPAHMEFYVGGGFTLGSNTRTEHHEVNPTTGKKSPFGLAPARNKASYWEEAYRIVGEFEGGGPLGSSAPLEELSLSNLNNEKFFYSGIGKGQITSGNSFLEQIVFYISKIIQFLLSSVLYMLRLVVLGYITLAEIILNYIVEGTIGGKFDRSGSDFGYFIDNKRFLTVENILFNKVEALKIDFFVTPTEVVNRLNGITATGRDVQAINQGAELEGRSAIARGYQYDNAGNPSDTFTEEIYNKSALAMFRNAYAVVYYTIFLSSFAVMFISLILVIIFSIIATVGEKKAKYKEYSIIWIQGLLQLFFSLTIVVLVIKANDFCIEILAKTLKESVADRSLHQTAREKAYVFNPITGLAGLIIYATFVYYTAKYFLMYLGRMLHIYLGAILGILTPVVNTIRKVATNKSEDYYKWYKDLVFNVFIQLLHALVYLVFAYTAFVIADNLNGLIGYMLIIVLLKYILLIDKEIRIMFAMEKNTKGSLSKFMENVTPLAYYNKLMKFEAVKRATNKIKEELSGEKLANRTVNFAGGVYNARQRIREIRADMRGERLNPELVQDISSNNITASTSQTPLNPEGMGLVSSEEINNVLNSNNITPEEKQSFINQIIEMQNDLNFSRSNIEDPKFFGYPNVFEKIKMDKFITTDSKGRKRMLRGDISYDKKKDKFTDGKTSAVLLKEAVLEERSNKDLKEAIENVKKAGKLVYNATAFGTTIAASSAFLPAILLNRSI